MEARGHDRSRNSLGSAKKEVGQKDFNRRDWQLRQSQKAQDINGAVMTLERALEKLIDAADRERSLRDALRQIMEEKIDYMRINNLGDPETQHTIKAARAALSN